PRSRSMRIAVHAACESLFTIGANMHGYHPWCSVFDRIGFYSRRYRKVIMTILPKNFINKDEKQPKQGVYHAKMADAQILLSINA
ncbi:hypothetical protein, partial [Cysteiniphilum litorale]|uniref:hypothetical protein n=1 Tax=Cysteiniphilum litorale TaxID=2056700 RepID=UPI003F881883